MVIAGSNLHENIAPSFFSNKFDPTVFRKVTYDTDKQSLQDDLDKIENCYGDIDRNMFFKFKEGIGTRGHEAILVKEQCRLDTRKYSFSQRMINEWNKLSNNCVNVSSVNKFKI